ncbi:MAG: MFS transporter [Kibdelosporangium sp.]
MAEVLVQRAGRREWLGLTVVVLPCLLVSMDLSVLFYALPFISAELAPSSSELLWIMDLYGFVLAGFLVTMGTLGDRIGRRKLLLAGAGLFGAASVLAAYANSTEMLIGARALLGVAGATLAPSTLSLIRNMFQDARQRQTAISFWTMGFAGGALVGPIAGGVLLEHFWWGSVFLLNVPVMALLLVLGPILLPEYRDPAGGRFDVTGALLSLAAILPVIYGVKKIAADGLAWSNAGAIVFGLAIGAVFVHRMRTVENPMIDVKLFARVQFSGAVLASTITFLVFSGLILYVTQYLQLVLGYGPLAAALWNIPGVLGVLVGVSWSAAVAARLRPAVIVATGLLFGSAGFVLVTPISATEGLAWVVASQVVLSIGIGTVATIATELVLATAPKESAGAGAAVSETANEFGGAAGIALLGSIGAGIYRAELTDTAPADVPVDALAAARESLGAAVRTAGDLPLHLRDSLIAAANQTFVTGMQWVAWIGAAGLLLMSAFVVVVLRRIPPTAGSAE